MKNRHASTFSTCARSICLSPPQSALCEFYSLYSFTVLAEVQMTKFVEPLFISSVKAFKVQYKFMLSICRCQCIRKLPVIVFLCACVASSRKEEATNNIHSSGIVVPVLKRMWFGVRFEQENTRARKH